MAEISISDMRSAIINAYPGTRWRDRVMLMGDDQVYAIYKRCDRDHVFTRPKPKRKYFDPSYHQMTLSDYGIKV